jgi:hypothetical protein
LPQACDVRAWFHDAEGSPATYDIVGNANNAGGFDYNMSLSQRADATPPPLTVL